MSCFPSHEEGMDGDQPGPLAVRAVAKKGRPQIRTGQPGLQAVSLGRLRRLRRGRPAGAEEPVALQWQGRQDVEGFRGEVDSVAGARCGGRIQSSAVCWRI